MTRASDGAIAPRGRAGSDGSPTGAAEGAAPPRGVGGGARARELRERTGIDIGWRKSGALSIARTDGELAALDRVVRSQRARGLAAEVVDASGARAIEREIGGPCAGAAHFPDEAQVDPPL